jgi:hypothetical protein
VAWLEKLDARAQKGPRLLFWAFRGVAGALCALGLLVWLAHWFEQSFILGAIQAVFCAVYLAGHLGILPARRRTQT